MCSFQHRFIRDLKAYMQAVRNLVDLVMQEAKGHKEEGKGSWQLWCGSEAPSMESAVCPWKSTRTANGGVLNQPL
ncbi:MAG: hypothetical protein R6V55_09995 [Desulfovermiculus sp.]